MRPRRLIDPQAVLADAVRTLADKFDYPDEFGRGGVASIPIVGGGGGMVTVVVAASDATDLSKSRADFVCTGTNDDLVVQEAVDLINLNGLGLGGEVQLTEGQFRFGWGNAFALVDTNQPGISITGRGPGATIIIVTGNPGVGDSVFTLSGQGSTIRRLRIEDNHTTATAITAMFVTDSYSLVDDVTGYVGANSASTFLDMSSPNGVIRHVIVEFADIAFSITQSGTWIVDCAAAGVGEGIVAIGDGLHFLINNQIGPTNRHGIRLDGTTGNTVIGNTITDPGSLTNNTYDGIFVLGDADRNFLVANRIWAQPAATNAPRYGINISAATCDDNIYVANWAGPTANFGTAPYNDAGTGTLNVWPGAAAPQGDNFIL